MINPSCSMVFLLLILASIGKQLKNACSILLISCVTSCLAASNASYTKGDIVALFFPQYVEYAYRAVNRLKAVIICGEFSSISTAPIALAALAYRTQHNLLLLAQ